MVKMGVACQSRSQSSAQPPKGGTSRGMPMSSSLESGCNHELMVTMTVTASMTNNNTKLLAGYLMMIHDG